MATISRERILDLWVSLKRVPNYKSPGRTDEKIFIDGGDCSGAWVYIFWKLLGKTRPHGSNSQYRQSLSSKGEIKDYKDLRAGMGIFKCSKWQDVPPDTTNKWHGTEPGNMTHVGGVVYSGYIDGVYTVIIFHLSTSGGRSGLIIDRITSNAKMNRWTHWGWFDDAEQSQELGGIDPAIATYDTQTPQQDTPVGEPFTPCEYTVHANGGLRMRKTPSTQGAYMMTIPDGAILTITEIQNGWGRYQVEHEGDVYTGWSSMEYMVKSDEVAQGPSGTQTEGGPEKDPSPDTAGFYVVTAGGGLRMWSKSSGGNYMMMIPDESVVEVSQVQNGRGKITHPSKQGKDYTGWISMDYLIPAKESVD